MYYKILCYNDAQEETDFVKQCIYHLFSLRVFFEVNSPDISTIKYNFSLSKIM